MPQCYMCFGKMCLSNDATWLFGFKHGIKFIWVTYRNVLNPTHKSYTVYIAAHPLNPDIPKLNIKEERALCWTLQW